MCLRRATGVGLGTQYSVCDRARVRARTFESGHDGRQFAVELHIHNRADHLGHPAARRVRRSRGREPTRGGDTRFDTARDGGALHLANRRELQARPGNTHGGGPKRLPGQASSVARETPHDGSWYRSFDGTLRSRPQLCVARGLTAGFDQGNCRASIKIPSQFRNKRPPSTSFPRAVHKRARGLLSRVNASPPTISPDRTFELIRRS